MTKRQLNSVYELFTDTVFQNKFLEMISCEIDIQTAKGMLQVVKTALATRLGEPECYLCAVRKITGQTTTIDNRNEYYCSECGKDLFSFTSDDERYKKEYLEGIV